MEIKWEKLPERLHSEALKCLICSVMQAYVEKEGPVRATAHACVYMTRALTTEEDEPFTKKPSELMEHLDNFLEQPADIGVTDAFIDTHAKYIRDRTREVIERAAECLRTTGKRK